MNKESYEQGAACAIRECLFPKMAAADDLAPARSRAEMLNMLFGGGALGLAVGGHALEKKLMPESAARTKWIPKLREAIQLPSDIKVETGLRSWLLSHYDPKTKTIRVKSDIPPGVLAHEMGHASGAMRDTLHKTIKYTRIPALMGATLAPMFQTSGMEPGSAEWNAVTYGPAALMAPTLAEEARASYRALKALNRVGGRGAMLRGILSLLPAFGTYAAGAAAPIVSGSIIRKAYKDS